MEYDINEIMSFRCHMINIDTQNIAYIHNAEHYISYINDKLYMLCNARRGDTILVNDKYIFGYDGYRFIPSEDDYIPIAVGNDIPIDTFNRHVPNLDHILLDIGDHVKKEMLDNLTPFNTMYKGRILYFMTTNPMITYKKIKNIIETCDTLLLGYEDDVLIYYDIDHDFHIDMQIISFNEDRFEAIIGWNNREFHIRYSYIMHLMLE